jgi:hypothetical protein
VETGRQRHIEAMMKMNCHLKTRPNVPIAADPAREMTRQPDNQRRPLFQKNLPIPPSLEYSLAIQEKTS